MSSIRTERDDIEHDTQIPDNIVISTPGGVSGIQHHYTKGMYSPNDTSFDIYGNASNRYISGEYGNIYKSGHSVATAELTSVNPLSLAAAHLKSPIRPTDTEYWSNTESLNSSHTLGSTTKAMSQNKDYKKLIENFRYESLSSLSRRNREMPVDIYGSTTEDIEYMGPPDVTMLRDEQSSNDRQNKAETSTVSNILPSLKKRHIRFNQYLVFFLVVILYISFSFWYEGIVKVLSKTFHKGVDIPSKYMFMYAAILTILFFLIIYIADIPLITFEDVA